MALILHDATEARQKTFEAIESERIHSLTLLAASVAHEIGNPLNALHIHLQLMERQKSKNCEPPRPQRGDGAGFARASDSSDGETAEIGGKAGALSGSGQGGNHAAGLHRHPISAGHPALRRRN